VLVIAGPGTGKTQLIAARIGYILSSKDTQANPENILCLTYTDAGAVAMRKRLLGFIGPTAYRIGIYTFHSFCNQVVQSNLDISVKDSWNRFLSWKMCNYWNQSYSRYRLRIR